MFSMEIEHVQSTEQPLSLEFFQVYNSRVVITFINTNEIKEKILYPTYNEEMLTN